MIRHPRRHLLRYLATVALAALAAGTVILWPTMERTHAPLPQRPMQWATTLQAPGLSNFHRVSDTLYRGAPPTAEGFCQLEAMGIRTVVDLRTTASDEDLARGTGLKLERIPMKAWHAEDQDVVKFLRIATNPGATPVFVHCRYGSDRTGMMCAAYRIVVCGWSKPQAIAEMTEGSFGYHEIWDNLVEYIQKMDVERIRSEAGQTSLPVNP